MTRIAFCDDDAALLHQMQDFLEQYRTLRGGRSWNCSLIQSPRSFWQISRPGCALTCCF